MGKHPSTPPMLVVTYYSDHKISPVLDKNWLVSFDSEVANASGNLLVERCIVE